MSLPIIATTPVRASAPDLAGLVGAIGDASFGARLLAFLHRLSGAEHCVAYRLNRHAPSALAAGSLDGGPLARRRAALYLQRQFWRRDPAIAEAIGCSEDGLPAMIRMRIPGLIDTELREAIFPRIAERLVLYGRDRTGGLGLSVLRSDARGEFDAADVERLAGVADMLLAVVAKHADWRDRVNDRRAALSSAVEIEHRLERRSGLPRREAQVCARILYGLSTAGIALDLGIGEESVKTYRKRAYRRLQLGCEHELLKWYLALGD